MIGQATKRETLPSPLGALLPITVQVPYCFQKIFSPSSQPFDIFSKTTKVCKRDSRVHLYTIHLYSSQRGYGSIVYS